MGTSTSLLLAPGRCHRGRCGDRLYHSNVCGCLCGRRARSRLLLVLYRSKHDQRLLGRLSVTRRDGDPLSRYAFSGQVSQAIDAAPRDPVRPASSERGLCTAGLLAFATGDRSAIVPATYEPSGANAWARGPLGIAISPENGWLKSSIRKIAADAERALANSAATIVKFGRANRPKLAKIIMSQNTRTAMKGLGIPLPDSARRTRV